MTVVIGLISDRARWLSSATEAHEGSRLSIDLDLGPALWRRLGLAAANTETPAAEIIAAILAKGLPGVDDDGKGDGGDWGG